MNYDPHSLIQIQSWMQSVITHPAGIRAGVASEDACSNIDVSFADLEKVITRSKALTGDERLMIYSRSYHARLLECFQVEFPCLLRALGNDLFSHFVVEYLQHHPPRSYTLHDLAKNFPRFLKETRPDAEASADERESWPDFIIDLATLERAFIETYDGPGTEGQPLMDAHQILTIDSATLFQAQFTAAPCLKLFAFRYPVFAYFKGVRAKTEPEWPAPSNTFLAVNRKNYIVRFLELSSIQYDVLTMLVNNQPVSHVLTVAASDSGHDMTSLAVMLRAWLREWVEAGFFFRNYQS